MTNVLCFVIVEKYAKCQLFASIALFQWNNDARIENECQNAEINT